MEGNHQGHHCFNDPLTGCSDCETFALRQVRGRVSNFPDPCLYPLFENRNILPTEEKIAQLLTPNNGKSRNKFGIYSPNPGNKDLFQPGLDAKKLTQAKKVIVERNLYFL